MVSRIQNLFIFPMLYLILNLPFSTHGAKQVPCIFFFGDSLSDDGNNNHLRTLAKVDYPPYGIDFPTGPTGRFSNGKNVPDFLAEFLGFDKPIPPFATAHGPEILQGVNYASGGAGILDDTSADQGGRFSMNAQLVNHKVTISKIELLLRNKTSSKKHLNKCLYVVNIGTNDYINNYLLQYFATKLLYTPREFAALLIEQYDRQLRTLYNYGARKVAVFGLGSLGSLPALRANRAAYGNSSVASTNKVIQRFNTGLKPLIDNLNADLEGAQFVFINITNIVRGNFSSVGVRVTNVSCCVTSEMPGLCVAEKIPCSNRSEYLFWDNIHPTENVNRAAATRAYTAASPGDAYPTDIQNLVRLQQFYFSQ